MTCHCGDTATYYYDTVGRGRQGLCIYHADRFGYPQYLVRVAPLAKDWRPEYGYLLIAREGNGVEDEVCLTWPFPAELAEWWVEMTGHPKRDAQFLIADAAWEPYRAHYADTPKVPQVEARRVTVLPLV
ncbi:hypothetical protein [Streptomyces sp. NPDC002547]